MKSILKTRRSNSHLHFNTINNLHKCKRSNSHLHFNTINNLHKCKRSQAQVITTVLLILISIAAIAIVSTVVINFVRNRLVFTECFDTLGQISIDVESEFTYYNSSSNNTYVSIKRGPSRDFNLTGLLIILQSSGGTSDSYELNDGKDTDDVTMYDSSSTIQIPGPGGTRTYIFSKTKGITGVEVAPILEKGQCDVVDVKSISEKS